MADGINTDSQIQAFPPSSRSPRGGECMNANEGDHQLFQDTVPFDDTIAVDNCLVKTQLEKLDFDTEIVDDSDCVEDVRLQLVSDCEKEVVLDSEDEGIRQAELVNVVSEFSGLETGGRIKGNVVDLQKRQLSPPSHQLEGLAEDSDGFASDQCGAGALINDKSTSSRKVPPQYLSCGQESARLNYISFEEPGESSQAGALDFVDHFLSSNDVGLSPKTEPRSTIRRKFSPVSSAKGPQLLAKHMKTGTPVGKNGTFEWVNDDQHGGVELFSITKDVSFDFGSCQQRSVVRQQKAGHIDNKGGCSSDNKCKEKTPNLHKEVTGSLHSDLRVALEGAKEICRIERVSGMNSERNSLRKPNEQLNAISSVPELDAYSIERNTPDMFDVGFNTQMAAEVMEALSYGPPAFHSAGDAYQRPQNFLVDSSKGATKSEVHFKRTSPQNGVLSNLNGTARMSKQRKCSAKKLASIPSWKHICQQDLAHGLEITTKRRRSKHLVDRLNGRNSIHESESSARKSPKPVEQRKEEEAVSRNNITVCENCGSSSKLVKTISLGTQQIQGEPAPHRTGHSMTEAKLERTEDESDNQRKKMNDVMGGSLITYKRKSCLVAKPSEVLRTEDESDNQRKTMNDVMGGSLITYKRKRSCLGAKPSEGLSPAGQFTKLCFNSSGKARNNDLSQQKQASLSALNSSSKLNAWSCPKGKRTHRKLVRHLNRASNQCNPFTKVEGQEHHKKPLSKNLPKSSLLKELIRLGIPKLKPDFAWKDLRKRRDMTNVRILFSQHLDNDIIKQQRKILVRLGISIASCSMDATHFIADRFVRTRNMLEAIALCKPVVTHLWIESCGQASCLIDEKNYVLRDAKKEKEIGFSLPVSLARANQHPLLKGRKVLITPNIKPDKEMITSLVKIVQGQAVEKSQISALKMPGNLLILSCDEDYAICAPFLDNGAAVYSSELLLNGIVIQKLEYERHQLFMNREKKNRPSKRSKDHGEFLL